MKQYRIKNMILGAAALLIVGCDNPLNRSANPMKDYQELSDDVPPHQYVSNEQKFDGVLFDLQVDGQSGNSQMEFYEGSEQTYLLNARVFVPGLRTTLVHAGLPKGATLKLVDRAKGVWALKWAPSKGTIPPGSQRQSFPIKIGFEIDPRSSVRSRQVFDLDRRNRVKEFVLNVNFSDALPTIKVTGMKSEIKYGEVLPLVVQVTDKNSSEVRRPEVVAIFDRANLTAEARTFPASSAVIVDTVRVDKYKGNGVWEFYFLFDSTTIPSKYLTGKGYEGGEFVMVAINPSTRQTVREVKRFKLRVEEGAKP